MTPNGTARWRAAILAGLAAPAVVALGLAGCADSSSTPSNTPAGTPVNTQDSGGSGY